MTYTKGNAKMVKTGRLVTRFIKTVSVIAVLALMCGLLLCFAVSAETCDPETGHSLEFVPAKIATKEENGYRAHYVCTACGLLFLDSSGEKGTDEEKIRTEYFEYGHDPSENPKAMEDIEKDGSAVYGFRPNSTGSLKLYASADWSDPDIVEQGRLERIAYHESISSMYEILTQMLNEGKTVEEIARAVSTRRNEIRLEACGTSEELSLLKQRNLEKYGHEEGPLPDELYTQYGSWEKVIQKAFSSNPGMDACLGLYDDYYDYYVALDKIENLGTDTSDNTDSGNLGQDGDGEVSPQTGEDGYIVFCVILMLAGSVGIAATVLSRKKVRND